LVQTVLTEILIQVFINVIYFSLTVKQAI